LQDKACLNAVHCLGFQILKHLVCCLSCELAVLLHSQTLLLHSSCEVVQHLSCLCVDHGIRDLDSCVGNCLLYSLVLLFCLSFRLFLLFDLCLDVCLVFIQCVKLGNFCRELIVDLRELFCLDLVDHAFKYSFFALQILCVIVFRESNLHFFLLAGIHANK